MGLVTMSVNQVFTKDISKREILMAKELLPTLTVESIKVTGSMGCSQDTESSHGQMVTNMKASTSMESKKAEELSTSQTVRSSEVDG